MEGNPAEYPISVIRNPAGWEMGIYGSGVLIILVIVGVNLWKLCKSGNYPAPSPFPHYDYRYLEQKYGTSYSEVRQKRTAASSYKKPTEKSFASQHSSLKIDEAYETINELGTLELMMKEVELSSYGSMKKSVSTDSLNSISSIGNNFGYDFTVGQIEMCLEYDVNSNTMHVTLVQGKDLLEKEDVNFESCFVRISLLPDEQIVGISRIQRNAFSVFFDEKFSIPLDPSALEENSLRFSVFGIDEDERNISTGLADLKLSDLDLTCRAFNAWLYLQDVNKATDTVGEILLSLSYLPTAERLTVVVVKAKNLVWNNGKTTSDPFVKVYLLQDTRKISKKRTAIKRDDPNPVFNEAMIFSVPAIVLQDFVLQPRDCVYHDDVITSRVGDNMRIYWLKTGSEACWNRNITLVSPCFTAPLQMARRSGEVGCAILQAQELSLRITVAECCEEGRTENIGHVIIGPESSGMGSTHWNQMLATLRKPVSMWHALRKN